MGKDDKIGITVKKNDNFSEWYSQLVGENGAQLVDLRYGVQGFVVYRETGWALLKKVYEFLENAVEQDDHEQFLFPVVIPEENLKKEEEHAGFTPEVFWVTKGGDTVLDKPLALRPTGETALYPMYSLWIRSHNDLPFKRYQSRIMVYRNEMTTRPFIRGREFAFFETHDVFRTHKEALDQMALKVQSYLREKKEIGIADFTDLTGLSRKFALPLLEYLDGAGVTIRLGDKRVLRKKGEG